MMHIAQGIGMFALAFMILSYQNNDRRKILIFLLIAQLFWTMHFTLLGAMTAATVNIIAAFRSYLYFKNWSHHKLIPPSFILVFVVVGIFTWNGPISILPVLGQSIVTYAFWCQEPRKIRLLTLIPRPVWFVYHLIVGSYAGILAEIFVSGSIMTAIVRFDVLKKVKRRAPIVLEDD